MDRCGRPPERRRTRSPPGSAGLTCQPRWASAWPSSSTWPATSARTGTAGRRCSAWAARAWRRSCSVGSSAGPAARAEAARPRPAASSFGSSTRRIPTRCADFARGPRSSERSSWSAPSRAAPPNRTPSRRRWARSLRPSTSSRSPIPTPRSPTSLEHRSSARSSPPRPTSVAATRHSASSAWCRPRSRASTSPGCWTARAGWPTRAVCPTQPRTRAFDSGPSSERRRSPAATS